MQKFLTILVFAFGIILFSGCDSSISSGEISEKISASEDEIEDVLLISSFPLKKDDEKKTFLTQRFPNAKIHTFFQNPEISYEKNLIFSDSLVEDFSAKNTRIILLLHSDTLSPFSRVSVEESLLFFDSSEISRFDASIRPALWTAFSLAEKWKMRDFSAFPEISGNFIFGSFAPFDDSSEHCGVEDAQSCLREYRKNSGVMTQRATVLFFGDMMFDRYIRATLDTKGWEHILGPKMKRLMNDSDLTVVNFESAITADAPYKAHDLMMSFTSHPKWIEKMKEYGINLVGLANNHTFNRDKLGFAKTLYSLKKAEISAFGNPYNKTQINEISVVKNIRGMKIGFIGYHELFRPNPQKIFSEISRLKKEVDFVVIFAHWGEEYQPLVQKRLQIKAHQFVDKGADLVVGHHPHVVAAREEYKGKMIYYSLGNFVFDQIRGKSVRRRLALGITFECDFSEEKICNKKNITPTLFPLKANSDYQVQRMNEAESQKFLKYLEKVSP